jgi:DNA-binding Lrp family transcriptional regulator
VEFDDIDRRIAHALQIDGRAPFTRIGQVLGVSDQTVARRFRRLRREASLRVAGGRRVRQAGGCYWLVRVSCAPGVAEDLAGALARRDGTRWVSLMSGGTEISFSTRVQDEATLLRQLPRTRQVHQVTAHAHLHTFFGGPLSLVNKSGALGEGQVARLREALAASLDGVSPTEPGLRGDGDRRLAEHLEYDGRAPVADLAAATGWSQTTVRRRLAELRANGTLYFDVEYAWELFGLATRTALWLSVPPARLAEAGRTLAAHPEVAYCCATTGPTNLFAIVITANTGALYRYLTERVASLPSVERMETAPVIRSLKGMAPLGPPARAGARPRVR